jgi:hypothetical protein
MQQQANTIQGVSKSGRKEGTTETRVILEAVQRKTALEWFKIQYFVSKSGREEGTTETREMLETVQRKTVLEWFKRFRDKREGPVDEPKSEKLSNVRSLLNC